jgi:uncharacterized protein (DUF952 family)
LVQVEEKVVHMNIILHITQRGDWETSASCGYYKPSSLNSDGFIHCSSIEQTVDTANQFYPSQHGLVILCIDENNTEAEIKYEGPVCVGDQRVDVLFPHIYGPLNVSAVVRVVDFIPDVNGKFRLPEEIGRLTANLG